MQIHFQDQQSESTQSVDISSNESVLEGLLRAGYDIPYGCRSGVCQSCLMQCKSNNIPDKAQTGLKRSQKELGYFLACSCFPKEQMDVSYIHPDALKVKAKVLEKRLFNDDVLRLRLEKVFDYRAGQFSTLWKSEKKGEEKTARCYSLASLADDEDFLEFHIKRVTGGIFSEWAFEELQVGDTLHVQEPMGECFYTSADSSQALFLSGIGTGLAPLYGIVRDAIARGHNGKIDMVIAAKESDDFYYIDELADLANQYVQLNVHLVSQKATRRIHKLPLFEMDVYQFVQEKIPNFRDYRVFLCGANSFVQKMKKQCFMSGANMPDISADAFLAFGFE